MDLLCFESTAAAETSESSTVNRRAYADPTLLNDDRVLANLLRAEEHEKYNLFGAVFPAVQDEVTPEMRKVVAEWMWEVCEEQKCQDEVFVLAMNLVDRFLAVCKIRKNQLQLLGTSCMLLASKLREPTPLSTDNLVYYTDNSITVKELWRCELLVLSKLKWDVAAVTPQDFLCHILRRLPVESVGIEYCMIDSHAKTLIALCAREFAFSKYPSSMIASACIASALCGLGWKEKSHQSLSDLINTLHNITFIEEDYLLGCLKQIDHMVVHSASSNNNSYSHEDSNNSYEMSSQDNRSNHQVVARPDEFTPPPSEHDKLLEHESAGTPTDIRDIHF